MNVQIRENGCGHYFCDGGYDEPEYVERAKHVAPFGYIMKPFDEREIRGAIEIALHKKMLELKLAETHRAA